MIEPPAHVAGLDPARFRLIATRAPKMLSGAYIPCVLHDQDCPVAKRWAEGDRDATPSAWAKESMRQWWDGPGYFDTVHARCLPELKEILG